MYNVAIVGAGFAGEKYAMACYQNTELYLKCVCDNNNENAERIAKKYAGELIYTDWKDVVRLVDIDILIVAVPNDMHYEVCVEGVKNGKHILCEKPLCFSYEELTRIMEMANENGVFVSCCYNLIDIPAIIYLKNLIDSDKLGELVCFRGAYDDDRLADKNVGYEWRLSKKFSAGGGICDLGINIISVSQFLFGNIESLVGMTDIVHRYRRDANGEMLEVENDDVSQFMFKYKNGGTGYIVSNRVAHGVSQGMAFEAQFTRGTIRFSLKDINEVDVFVVGNDGFENICINGKTRKSISYDDLRIINVAKSIECIKENKKAVADFFFAYEVDRVVGAVLKSSESQKWVNIN